MDTAVKAVLGFVFFLCLIVAVRIRSKNKIDVKTADVALALTPVALWLFLTGQIQELTVGDVKIVAAIKAAAESPVSKQLTELPIQTLEIGAKGGVGDIANIRRKKSQALRFTVGHGGYYGPAIAEYLETLTQDPIFRYVVINYPDGKFFGMADARQLAAQTGGPSPSFNLQSFADALNDSNESQLESLPGFIAAQRALSKTSDRRKALETMDTLDVQTLPVIDKEGRLAGIVDRSKLTASMLIDIAAKVEGGK
ncbi:MAG: hypothetical protein ACREQ9_14975 [Candidatus Binatia bacterium]